jgi:hypothetical protein
MEVHGKDAARRIIFAYTQMERQIIYFHCMGAIVGSGHKATLKSHDQARICLFRMMEYAIKELICSLRWSELKLQFKFCDAII